MSTPDEGVAVYVVAAFDENIGSSECSRPHYVTAVGTLSNSDIDHNGAYLYDCRPANPCTETVKPWATSPVEAERLWKLSEKLIGQEFQY